MLFSGGVPIKKEIEAKTAGWDLSAGFTVNRDGLGNWPNSVFLPFVSEAGAKGQAVFLHGFSLNLPPGILNPLKSSPILERGLL